MQNDHLVAYLSSRLSLLRSFCTTPATTTPVVTTMKKDGEDDQHRVLEMIRLQQSLNRPSFSPSFFLKPLVVMATGLDDDELSILRRLCGGRLRDAWGPRATHVVCGCDHRGVARRTLKYLMGVASGAFVVTRQWMEQWNQKQQRPDEMKYLCEGDAMGGVGGPLKAASHGAPVMQGKKMALVEPLEVGRKELEQVAQACGCDLVDEKDAEVVITSSTMVKQKRRLKKRNQLWVTPDWLLDTAASHDPELDVEKYLVPDETAQEEDEEQQQERQQEVESQLKKQKTGDKEEEEDGDDFIWSDDD